MKKFLRRLLGLDRELEDMRREIFLMREDWKKFLKAFAKDGERAVRKEQ